jgi:hypothetical protein
MSRLLLLSCALLALSSEAFAAWTNGTVSASQALIRRQPNGSAEVLGHLRQGKKIRIYTPDRAGYYAVNFGKQIKGATVGWILSTDVAVDGGGEPSPAPPGEPAAANDPARKGQPQQRRTGGRVKPSWLDVSFVLQNAAPSAFQEAISEEAKGVSSTGFSLGYAHHAPGSKFGFAFEAFYYSMSGTGTNGTYQAKGFGGRAGIDLQFVNSNQFSFDGILNIGMSINSAGNANSTVEFDTTNIIAFPIRLGVDLRKYFGGFGLLAGAGYQIMSLKEVPVVLEGPLDADGNPPEGLADLSLSGLYFHLGVSIAFD